MQGDDLVNIVSAVCPNTIVVVHAVGPVLMPWADNPNVTAIVFAGLPGLFKSSKDDDNADFGKIRPGKR